MLEKPGYWIVFIVLSLLLLVLAMLDVILGPADIKLIEVFNVFFSKGSSDEITNTIIFQYRLPKVFTAIFAGSALSVSGLQMQTIFRNPLAGPYVLGISAGASLGVAVMLLGYSTVFSGITLGVAANWPVAFFAWLGAGSVLFIILLVSIRLKDIMTLLILGILFSYGVSAIVNVLQYFSNADLLKSYMIWTMGSLGNVPINHLYVLGIGVGVGLLLSLLIIKPLNILLMGEEYAKSMGLNVFLTRVIVFVSTSLLAGSVTAFCGPIGFIGIAVPHLCRVIFKTSNHGVLIPASAMLGAILLLIGDILSPSIPGFTQPLPINSITAIMGIPIVIWVVFKNFKMSSGF